MLFRFRKKYTAANLFKHREIKKLNELFILHRLRLRSANLERKVKVDIFLPEKAENCRATLILNDGQDMGQLKLVETLTRLITNGEIAPIAVVAIFANENRMLEYGVAGFPDYKKRGSKAARHLDFVIKELTPFLQKEYGLMNEEHPNVFAGFSMGGLSALDISWNYPGLFKKVGVFSGSLWWRTLNTGTAQDDDSRIMHQRIRAAEKKEGFKFWLQTGTKDETRDRNKNGIIDSIDDTRDLIKELKALGYTNEDITYEELAEGQHNFETWSAIFPSFLKWAFPKEA